MGIGKKSSNLFGIVSILGAGSYYATNTDLYAPKQQLQQNGDSKVTAENLKNKSIVDSLSSSLVNRKKEITFNEWTRTANGIEAYEKWRKTPAGINKILEKYGKTLDFQKALNIWASHQKRSIKEFRKIALKKQSYHKLFTDWKSSNEAIKEYAGLYESDPSFKTKSEAWINSDVDGELKNKDVDAYLKADVAKKDYENWVKDNQGAFLDEWKKSTDYQTKRDQWLAKENKKDSKETWLGQAQARTHFQSWKASAKYRNDIISYWKKQDDYKTKKDQWISVYAHKKTLDDYKNQESLWSNSYNNYKKLNDLSSEIVKELQKKQAYIDAKNSWSNTGRDLWINSNDSNAAYNAWRLKATSRETLKPHWYRTNHYKEHKEDWIDDNYVAKTKELWLKEENIKAEYDAWKASDAGKKALFETWKKWKAPDDSIEKKKEWQSFVVYWFSTESYLNTKQWVKSEEGQKYYNEWWATSQAKAEFDVFWKSNTYATYKLNWARANGVTSNIDQAYRASAQMPRDRITFRDKLYKISADKNDVISNGENVFLSDQKTDSNHPYNKVYLERLKNEEIPKHKDFDRSLNYWHGSTNEKGLSTYNNSPQSDIDYQKWVYNAGENSYRNDKTSLERDLDKWSATKSNAVNFYKASAKYQQDWNHILDQRFAATTNHQQKINELEAIHGKNIYKDSNQFITDYNSWVDPNIRTEAKYNLDEDGVFSTDLNAFYNSDDKKFLAYKASAQSDSDYNLYTRNLKTEKEYLASKSKDEDLKSWSEDFENGKNIFKNSDFVAKKRFGTKESYKKSNQYKTDIRKYIDDSGDSYFSTYLSGARLQALYDNWKDPVGVERDPEAFVGTEDFTRAINIWSKNILNGYQSFSETTYAKSLYNAYKNK